jgi:hypothetical protein
MPWLSGLQFWVHNRGAGKTETSFFGSKWQRPAMVGDAGYGVGVVQERKVPLGRLFAGSLAGLPVPDLLAVDAYLFNYFQLVTGRSGLRCGHAGGVPE